MINLELRTPRYPSTKGIYAVSVPASRLEETTKLQEAMVAYMDDEKNIEAWKKDHEKMAWALAHCQLAPEDEAPRKAFVVHKDLFEPDAKKRKQNTHFPARVIFNALIVDTPEEVTRTVPVAKKVERKEGFSSEITMVPEEKTVSNLIEVPEGCMSFMERDVKNVKRYWRVKVRYQYITEGLVGYKFKTVEEYADGLKAQIFQHEVQHFEAKNIYHESN